MTEKQRAWTVPLGVLLFCCACEAPVCDSWIATMDDEGHVRRIDLKRWEQGMERVVYGFAPEYVEVKIPGYPARRFPGTGAGATSRPASENELMTGQDAPENEVMRCVSSER